MIWTALYMAALALALLLCWGRGFGYRRAAIILGVNLLVQVGCQLFMGDYTPSWWWMWLDLATAAAIALCPWAGRSHAVIAVMLACQVMFHLMFWAMGEPKAGSSFYLALTGFLGWGQLVTLVGGAWHGPLQRHWMAWLVGSRLAYSVARRPTGLEARK